MIKQVFTCSVLTIVAISSCFASETNAQTSTWRPSKLQQQGAISKTAYFKHSEFGQLPVTGRLRFINIRHDGPVNSQNVRQSFLSAAKWYDERNVTARPGGNNDFFKISGLNNNRCVVLGWCFYYNWGGQQRTQYNYIVVRMITADKVGYTRLDGKNMVAVKDPNHFQNYTIGTKSTPSSRVRIQIWKHGKDNINACACFYKN